jgi:hypothetical protein
MRFPVAPHLPCDALPCRTGSRRVLRPSAIVLVMARAGKCRLRVFRVGDRAGLRQRRNDEIGCVPQIVDIGGQLFVVVPASQSTLMPEGYQ